MACEVFKWSNAFSQSPHWGKHNGEVQSKEGFPFIDCFIQLIIRGGLEAENY